MGSKGVLGSTDPDYVEKLESVVVNARDHVRTSCMQSRETLDLMRKCTLFKLDSWWRSSLLAHSIELGKRHRNEICRCDFAAEGTRHVASAAASRKPFKGKRVVAPHHAASATTRNSRGEIPREIVCAINTVCDKS